MRRRRKTKQNTRAHTHTQTHTHPHTHTRTLTRTWKLTYNEDSKVSWVTDQKLELGSKKQAQKINGSGYVTFMAKFQK